ncbi:aryl-sulfate sulfotransferase [Planctomycetota bacterium]
MTCAARTKLTGTTFYSPSETHSGLTLFTPVGSKEVMLINMVGKRIHTWQMPLRPGAMAELLDNGNLLYAGKVEKGPLADFEGAGGKIMEVDKAGKTIWEYDEPYQHHAFRRLENGNTLILKWVKVPSDIAAKVQGGLAESELDGTMWGDAVQEITSDGKVAWEWVAHEHLDPEADSICPVCSRQEWTHMTSVDVLGDGNILLNCMRTNNIIVVNKKTGDIEFRWGKEELSHPNGATVLNNGNYLIFDNGRHCGGEGQGFSRALELDPEEKKICWGYEEDPPHFFYSSFLGSCQRLPNGNTLLLEGTTGRMLEVNQKCEMVWEYVSPDRFDSPEWGNNNAYVSSTRRYGLDHDGLRKFYGLEKDWFMWNDLESNKKTEKDKEAEKKPAVSMEDRIRSRLEPLGY